MIGTLRILNFLISMAFAQGLPEQFTVEGRLYSNGIPVSGSAVIRLEVVDSAKPSCVLYREKHNVNLTSTSGSNGFYAVALGSGSDVVTGGNSLSILFANGIEQKGDLNSDNVIDVADLSTCKFTPGPGAQRFVRIAFSLDGGSNYTLLSPDTAVTSAPTALVASSLQGKSATDFLQVNTGAGSALTQINLESVFDVSNFARLEQLLSPTAALDFSGQRLSGISDPTSAQDVATKNYADTKLAGFNINLNGVAPGANGGMVLAWDQASGQWKAQNIILTDVTKLPLSGGQMSGQLDMGGNVIWNTGHVVLGAGSVISLGTVKSPMTDASLGLGSTHDGATWYNRDDKFLTVWDGMRSVKQAYLSASGKLNPSWIGDASIGTSALTDGSVTTAKLISGGAPLNRILMTDGSTGQSVTFTDCAQNEILKFDTGTGWACASAGSLSPVSSVAGKTGVVSLNAADISGLGTASLHNVGVGASEIPRLDGGGRLPLPVIPLLSGDVTGDLSGTVVGKLRGNPISAAVPNLNDALRWNGSAWMPAAVVDTGITALTGDVMASGNGSVAATIQNGTVTNAKLAALAVGTSNIQDYSITFSKLASPGAGYFGGAMRWDGLNWNPSSALMIDGAGNVGIGTTSPIYKLEISGNAKASLFIAGTTTTNYTNGTTYAANAMPTSPAGASVVNSSSMDSTFAAVRLSARNGATNQQAGYIAAVSEPGAVTYSPNLVFGQYTDGTLTASAERMRISSQGNVGIGISPAARLHIQGDVVQQVTGTSGTSIDFTSGNIQYTTASCGVMNLSGLKSGGTYVLAVQGGGAGACTFNAPGFGLRTGTIVMAPASGKHIIFTFIVMGTTVYVASADNY